MVTNHFSALTESEQERLVIIIEECGEVIQAACKILRHGYESTNPKATSQETNRQALQRELGDLHHAASRMIRLGDVSGQEIQKRQIAKASAVLEYLHHNEE